MTPTDREPVHVHRHGADPLRVEPVEYHEPLDRKRPRVWLVVAALIVIVAVLFVTQVAGGRNASEVRPSSDSGPDGRAPVLGMLRTDTRGMDIRRTVAGPRSTVPAYGVPFTDTVGIAPAVTGLRGTATWCAPTPRYCRTWGGDAHLGAVASFRWGDRPYPVQVCRVGTDRCTVVTVVSYCACGSTLIDISPAAFRELAPLSLGRIHVVVTRLGGLPPTDTEEE